MSEQSSQVPYRQITDSKNTPIYQKKQFLLLLAIILPVVLFIIALIISFSENSSHFDDIQQQLDQKNNEYLQKIETLRKNYSDAQLQTQLQWEQKLLNLSSDYDQDTAKLSLELQDKYDDLEKQCIQLQSQLDALKQNNYSQEFEALNQKNQEYQEEINKLNSSLQLQQSTQTVQNLRLRTLINDNPFYNKDHTHTKLQFVSPRHLKSHETSIQNALLDFPLETNKIYTFVFQAFYPAFPSNMRLGISCDDHDWTTEQYRFTKYQNGYALTLNDGTKANNGTRQAYAAHGIETSGEQVSLIANTQKGTISFALSGVDQGLAFENIDFSAVTFYPAVALSQVGDELKFVKVDVSIA